MNKFKFAKKSLETEEDPCIVFVPRKKGPSSGNRGKQRSKTKKKGGKICAPKSKTKIPEKYRYIVIGCVILIVIIIVLVSLNDSSRHHVQCASEDSDSEENDEFDTNPE